MKKKGYYLLLLPSFLALFLLSIGPIVYSIYSSLFSWNLANPTGKKFIGLGNYSMMLQSETFWAVLKNTAVQVFGTLFFQVLLGTLLALLFSRKMRGQKIFRSLYMLPMMTTPVVVGMVWRLLLNPELGMINYLLSLFGISGPNWLGEASTAMPMVILSDVWLSTPFATIIILAGIQSLPMDVYEAARVDGASPIGIFFRITLPLLKPVMWFAILFRLMDAFKRFDSIYIMTSGGPGIATETLNLHAYIHSFNYLDIGYGSATAVFALLLIILFSGVILYKIQTSETY